VNQVQEKNSDAFQCSILEAGQLLCVINIAG